MKTTCQQVHDPSSSYMKDSQFKDILINELEETAHHFFLDRMSSSVNINFDFNSEVKRFMDLYSGRPHTDNTGGSGFHNAFWLYLFARLLNPHFIVESGVWKGHMCWLLEQACPDAAVLGFDINLDKLEYTKGKVSFYEQDWTNYQLKSIDPDKSMVFFDCHANHAKRILESCNRGFKHLLFDDNPPIHKLYGYGLPGFPTANMVHSGIDKDLTEVSWCWQGKEITYHIDRDEISRAKKLIQVHEIFPDVGGPTSYGGFSYLTYVRI